MPEDFYPVRWDGAQAVVTLPEHIGASNAGQVRNALLSVINYGAATLIADMTATVSCDHAGADAVVRAWQRTVSSGSELRLVVAASSVSRVLSMRGLDRQVSVYPSLDAAVAARLPAWAAAGRRDGQSPNDSEAAGPVDDLAVLVPLPATAARLAQLEHRQLLDEVLTGLFAVALGLRSAAGLPDDAAGGRTEAALGELDDIINQIRAAAFSLPDPAPPGAFDDDQ